MNPNYIHLPTALHAAIQKYGWITTGIIGENHSYTIGFTDLFQHPEIAIHGLSSRIAHSFMIALHEKLKAGERFEPGRNYDNISSGYPTHFIEVHPLNLPDWFGQATRVYGADTRILQMVWTDTKGKFPWEAGFERKFVGKQHLFNEPVLYPESTGQCDSRCASHGERSH